jgi:glucose/arabinose dehydrogenase
VDACFWVAIACGSVGCQKSSPPSGPASSPDATIDDAAAGSEGGPDADDAAGLDDATEAEGAGDEEAAAPQDAMADVGGRAMDAGLPTDPDAAPPGSFCALPGSVVWSDEGPVLIPGGAPTADVSWMHLPPGFCAHYFATVKTARQLKFAPGGELFAASPTTATTGGANNGVSGVVVLPDDDHDGVADTTITFLARLPSVQGLLFAGGYFYYQNGSVIQRVPYASGDRQPSGPAEVVTDLSTSLPQDGLHWPKAFDVAQDGTLYITNGGSQGDQCSSAWPARGAVVRLNPDHTTSLVAQGFRNPIALRCEQDHDVCLVVELALDYSGDTGGREKLVPVRQGDNWGYPCCATQNLPHLGVRYVDTAAVPDCSGVASETDSFIIGHTPFGVDFSPQTWPAPWNERAFVTLHGVVGSWAGARVVGIAVDTLTGLPLPATELDASVGNPDNLKDFATGWDDGRQDHGRPAPITFAPDGRMFVGDDQRGAVIWIAPVNLPMSP